MKKFEMPEIQVIDFGEEIMIDYMSITSYDQADQFTEDSSTPGLF